MVRPNGGIARPCDIGEEMLAKKGDIWRGGLVQGGESGKEVLVCNSKLQPPRRESFPSGRCPVINCSGESGGVVGVKIAEHHLVSAVLQKGIKVRDVVLWAGRCRGDIYVEESQCSSPHNTIDVLQAEWSNQQRAHIALPHCAMLSRAEWLKQLIYTPKVLNIRSLTS